MFYNPENFGLPFLYWLCQRFMRLLNLRLPLWFSRMFYRNAQGIQLWLSLRFLSLHLHLRLWRLLNRRLLCLNRWFLRLHRWILGLNLWLLGLWLRRLLNLWFWRWLRRIFYRNAHRIQLLLGL